MRLRHATVALAVTISLAACGGGADTSPERPRVTMTETVAPPTSPSGSPTAGSPTPAQASGLKPRVLRQIERSRRENKHHPNDGRFTWIVGDEGLPHGLVAALLTPCQAVAGMRNGCFISGVVKVKGVRDNWLVNPADFYVLGPDNQRYPHAGGESLFVPVNGQRLSLSNVNAGEVLSGVITFDAPPHGRLVYDPAAVDARVVWVY